MAMKRAETTLFPWDDPIWPERLPDSHSLRIVYGAIADELVVRFTAARHPDQVLVVPITTADRDDAGMLVAADSGSVLGVHVYPLAAFAVTRHPTWQAATDPDPSPEVANRIVNDVKDLFDRYGIDDPKPD
jgi:hypothetical protein